jgi:hypothetical protein
LIERMLVGFDKIMSHYNGHGLNPWLFYINGHGLSPWPFFPDHIHFPEKVIWENYLFFFLPPKFGRFFFPAFFIWNGQGLDPWPKWSGTRSVTILYFWAFLFFFGLVTDLVPDQNGQGPGPWPLFRIYWWPFCCFGVVDVILTQDQP